MPSPFRLDFVLAPSRRKAARITLALGGGVFLGEREMALSRAYLDTMLRCLTEINLLYLQAHPDTPRIERSGVIYREEPPGQEDWQDIPTSLKMGIADCEDLACWRAAELIFFEKVRARAVSRAFKRPDGGVLYHIVVEREDGAVEDPSKIRGMG